MAVVATWNGSAHLDDISEVRVERGLMRRQRSVAPSLPAPTRLRPMSEPSARLDAVAARNDVDELPPVALTICVNHYWAKNAANPLGANQIRTRTARLGAP